MNSQVVLLCVRLTFHYLERHILPNTIIHTHINQPQKPSYNTHFAITFLRDKHGLQKSLFEEVMINIRRTV